MNSSGETSPKRSKLVIFGRTMESQLSQDTSYPCTRIYSPSSSVYFPFMKKAWSLVRLVRPRMFRMAASQSSQIPLIGEDDGWREGIAPRLTLHYYLHFLSILVRRHWSQSNRCVCVAGTGVKIYKNNREFD